MPLRDHHPLKWKTVLAAVAIPALLILVGAGCMSFGGGASRADSGQRTADGALTATDPAADAKVNEEHDKLADDLSVGMIITENAEIPAGAVVVPGTIGCNDRVAYEKRHRETATDNVLVDALATLFAVKDSSVDAYYNALWQSKLAVEKIQSTDGVTTEVWLKGTVASGGACDDPRIKAQIEATIKRLRPKFTIYLNGSQATYRCLGDESGECK